jgi:hypothetical protein
VKRPIISSLLLACFLIPACIDFSPLPYTDRGAAPVDASVADVVVSDASRATCVQCLEQGPCASSFKACTASDACVAFEECMTDLSCWQSSLADLNHLPPCIITCSQRSGIIGSADPVVVLVAPLITCAQDPAKCASECPGPN